MLQQEVPSAARKSTPSEQLSRLPIWNDISGHHGTLTNHRISQQVHSGGWTPFSKWKKRSPFHAKKRTPEPKNWSMRSFPGTGHLGISTQPRDGTLKPSCCGKYVAYLIWTRRVPPSTTRWHGRAHVPNPADMLSKYVSDHHRDWNVHLPLVILAYRSSVHASAHIYTASHRRDVWMTAKPSKWYVQVSSKADDNTRRSPRASPLIPEELQKSDRRISMIGELPLSKSTSEIECSYIIRQLRMGRSSNRRGRDPR